jgi:hypothetical protein
LSDGDDDDDDSTFGEVVTKKPKIKHAVSTLTAKSFSIAILACQKTASPLFHEGISEDKRSNPLAIRKLLEVHSSCVAKTTTTNSGTILVFANSAADRETLMKPKLAKGFSLCTTKAGDPATFKAVPFVFITSVNPSIDENNLSHETNHPGKRIVSAKLGDGVEGEVQFSGEEDKTSLLKDW